MLGESFLDDTHLFLGQGESEVPRKHSRGSSHGPRGSEVGGEATPRDGGMEREEIQGRGRRVEGACQQHTGAEGRTCTSRGRAQRPGDRTAGTGEAAEWPRARGFLLWVSRLLCNR